MSEKVTTGRGNNSCDSIVKGSAEYQKELREIISQIESVKTRLNKVTAGLEDDYVENGSLGLSLCALDISLYALKEEITTADNPYEEIELCIAFSDLMADAKAMGIETGTAKDRTERKAENISETTLKNIKSMMKNLNVSAEEAMNLLKVDPLKRQAYAARVKES